MMINFNRQTVLVIASTLALGFTLGWFVERDHFNRKMLSVMADKLQDEPKKEGEKK